MSALDRSESSSVKKVDPAKTADYQERLKVAYASLDPSIPHLQRVGLAIEMVKATMHQAKEDSMRRAMKPPTATRMYAERPELNPDKRLFSPNVSGAARREQLAGFADRSSKIAASHSSVPPRRQK